MTKNKVLSLVFSHLGFWSGNLFLIAPFPDLCLLVPFYHFFFQGMSVFVVSFYQSFFCNRLF